MNVSFKLLSGQKFALEFPAEVTVGQVKETVSNEKGYVKEGMKLLFAGAILSDDSKKLSEYNVAQTGSTLVLMAKKGKWAASKPKQPEQEEQKLQQQAKQAASASASVSTTAAVETQKPVSETEKETETTASKEKQPASAPAPAQTTQAGTGQPAQSSVDSTLLAGDNYNQAVEQLMTMGFKRDRVEVCMRAAFNNPDRAAEFLLTEGQQEGEEAGAQSTQERSAEEIDSDLYGDIGGAGGAMEDVVAAGQGEGAEAGGGGVDMGQLLSQIPQFNELRAAVQANPNLLQPIMQQLASQSPELLQLISQNPQEFVRLLNEPPGQQQQQQTQAQQQGGLGSIPPELAALLGGGGGAAAGVGANRPGTIMVSEEDAEQIDQLMQLGFDRSTAAQAYFACDKDMNAAADFLLTSMTDDDWDDEQQQQQQGGGAQGGGQ